LEREPRALKGARGFVYYVSLTGITGSAGAPPEGARRRAVEVATRAHLPGVVGVGVKSAAQAAQVVAPGGHGAAVGPAIRRALAGAADPPSRVQAVRELGSALRRGLDRGVSVSGGG